VPEVRQRGFLFLGLSIQPIGEGMSESRKQGRRRSSGQRGKARVGSLDEIRGVCAPGARLDSPECSAPIFDPGNLHAGRRLGVVAEKTRREATQYSWCAFASRTGCCAAIKCANIGLALEQYGRRVATSPRARNIQLHWVTIEIFGSDRAAAANRLRRRALAAMWHQRHGLPRAGSTATN